MGYNFTIGKATVEYDEFDKTVHLTVTPCEGEPPHRDAFEMEPNQGVAWRMPSYCGWGIVLAEHPGFREVWNRLEQLVKEKEWKHAICIEHYLDDLDELEQEALRVNTDASQRVLWFVRWSRQAHRMYGHLGVFQIPGEWL